MENHPIPQDITSFQFKLVGSMTLKQFAFFATGVILGWIIISSPFFLLIKLPLALFFIASGFAIAFIPLDGRTLDTMITLFFKALFTPNQYVFLKTGGHFALPTLPKQPKKVERTAPHRTTEELQTLISGLPHKSKNDLDEKEMAFLQRLSFPLSSGSLPQVPKPPQNLIPPNQISERPIKVDLPKESKEIKERDLLLEQSFSTATLPNARLTKPTTIPQPQIITAEVVEEEKNKEEKKSARGAGGDEKKTKQNLEKEVTTLKKELEEAKQQEKKAQHSSPDTKEAHQKVVELEQQLESVLSEKERLEQKLAELSKKLEQKEQPVYKPSELKPQKETQKVRKVPKSLEKKVGLPFAPDVPNVITGIVKDPRGNVLPNILVEIKDTEENPVRAFKTNNLGLFASATPLQNGTYTIQFEDPTSNQKFDVIEIVVNGEIIPPLEVLSTDAREELRKELFGS